MTKLTVFYRISDKGNPKNRLQNLDYKSSLENFMKEFSASQIEVIADNVEPETKKWLESYNFKKLHETNLGNSGSFWYILECALKLNQNDFVYFVEDDYVHKPNAQKVLMEGLQIADYVTLYDHPDKYMDGINPEVRNGGEKTKVFLTDSCHWKITNSTTMTFASKVATLAADKKYFKAFTVGIIKTNIPFIRRISYGKSPRDFNLFICLRNLKKRILISSIPGYSTHGEVDYLSPLTNWKTQF
jgi:hypothetical protein